MATIQRKDLQLAESGFSDAFSDSKRSAPGMKYRESRIKIPKDVNCVIRWKDTSNVEFIARVIDISKYGCRIYASKDSFNFPLFTRITRGEILVDEMVAYNGAITFVNEKSNEGEGVSIGITLEGLGCDLDVIAATGSKSANLLDDIEKTLKIAREVNPDFKKLVADLNMLMQEVNIKLEKEEMHIKEMAISENHRIRLEERIINVALSMYRPTLQKMLSEFQELTKNFGIDEEIIHKQYFRLTFHSLLKGTPFVSRSLKKPLGYSGDYGMMVMLYEFIDQGETLFHKMFHRYVCSEPTAIANRNRIDFLSDILIEGYISAVKRKASSFKVTSLACGPAREIYEFVKHAPISKDCPVDIVLIDLEDFALDYAQKRLKEIPNGDHKVTLNFLKEDVVTGCIQGKEFLTEIAQSDFIISAGLFDYLAERVSVKMISKLFEYLKSPGQLLIGNISKKSPDIFAMDYFMDWRLILRDEPDLLRLISEEIKSRGAEGDVISEALGLNLFLRVRK